MKKFIAIISIICCVFIFTVNVLAVIPGTAGVDYPDYYIQAEDGYGDYGTNYEFDPDFDAESFNHLLIGSIAQINFWKKSFSHAGYSISGPPSTPSTITFEFPMFIGYNSTYKHFYLYTFTLNVQGTSTVPDFCFSVELLDNGSIGCIFYSKSESTNTYNNTFNCYTFDRVNGFNFLNSQDYHSARYPITDETSPERLDGYTNYRSFMMALNPSSIYFIFDRGFGVLADGTEIPYSANPTGGYITDQSFFGNTDLGLSGFYQKWLNVTNAYAGTLTGGAGYDEGYNDGYSDGNLAGIQAGRDEGLQEGYNQGFSEGQSDGYDKGYETGYDAGFSAGDSAGYQIGYDEGYGVGEGVGRTEGYETGYDEGHREGYQEGESVGQSVGYNNGYADGFPDGEETGYRTGYSEGFRAGDQGAKLDIPSIITSVPGAVKNVINTSFDFELFGINIAGLLATLIVVGVVAFTLKWLLSKR